MTCHRFVTITPRHVPFRILMFLLRSPCATSTAPVAINPQRHKSRAVHVGKTIRGKGLIELIVTLAIV